MLIGSGVAVGAAWDNKAKKEQWSSHPSVGEVIDVAVSSYESEVSETEIPDNPIEITNGKDETANATRSWCQQVSQQITEVLSAEEPILIRIRGMELAGTPDYITQDGIGDTKVGRAWNQEDTDRARQLTAYGLLHKSQFKRYPDKVWIDSLSRYRGDWIHERIWSSRTLKDYAAFLLVMERAVRAMLRGDALPSSEGSWWCSQAWCPFWSQCWAVGNGSMHG